MNVLIFVGFLYMFLAVCLVLGLCFLSLPIILVMYRRTNGKPDIAPSVISRQETNRSQSNTTMLQEIDSSDYESINDSEVNDTELLENTNKFPLRNKHKFEPTTIPWTQNNSNISNSKRKHSSLNSSSTESSNHSYIDVIADTDYLNPYQIINTIECEVDKHPYCITLEESRGGSNYINNGGLHLHNIDCASANKKYISLSQKTLVHKSVLKNTKMSNSDGDISLCLRSRDKEAIFLNDHSGKNNEITEESKLKWVIKDEIAIHARIADCAVRNSEHSNALSPVINITSKNAMSSLL